MIPLVAFLVLVVVEGRRVSAPSSTSSRADLVLNLVGFVMQGVVVPLAGYWLATSVLASAWPSLAGGLRIGWFGAFALNFVFVDFLFYWQHRLFHRVHFLWALHQCHHASRSVNVWATARNSLAINFLFVYLAVNAVLGFLCDRPAGFFTAAAVTAGLDLWRHARIDAPRGLGLVLVTPWQHHLHHSPGGARSNFGANFILWDRFFGTERAAHDFPDEYGTPLVPAPWRQFFFPW